MREGEVRDEASRQDTRSANGEVIPGRFHCAGRAPWSTLALAGDGIGGMLTWECGVRIGRLTAQIGISGFAMHFDAERYF
jgi:hypothetical protein